MSENTRPIRDYFSSLPSGSPARLVGTDMTTVFVQNLGKLHTVVQGSGISVDSSDIQNPIVSLSPGSLASLELADTSLQPGGVTVSDINAAGTPSDETFLRGDGTWSLAGDGGITSIVAGAGIEVNATTPSSPTVALDAASLASLLLADTAAQAADLATVATTGDYSDLVNPPSLGTAAFSDATDFATAAQGALAETALQPDSAYIVNMKDELYWIAVSS